MEAKNKLKNVWLYTTVVLLISWLSAGIFFFLGLGSQPVNTIIFSIFYMFFPAIAVLLVHKLIIKVNEPFRERYKIFFRPNKWFLAAWFLPIIIGFISIAASLLFPGVFFSPGIEGILERLGSSLTPEQLAQARKSVEALPVHPAILGVFQALIAGITINAVAAFGEELGWRGYLLKETIFLGFWRSSFLVGIIWGIWHAPLILNGHNYPQHPQFGVLMMTAFCLLYSPVFTYITLRANSVIAAAVLHGTINATAGFPILLINGGNDLTAGLTALPGLLVLLAVNILLYFYLKKKPSLLTDN